MKVGILVEDYGLKNINFTNIKKGNPGVGGTTFEEIILANELSSQLGYEIILYCSTTENYYPQNLKVQITDSINTIPYVASTNHVDVLIFCAGKKKEWYIELTNCKISCIVWVHGFLNYYEQKAISKCSSVKRVVFVGREHYFSYINDDIIKKATYIYNMFENYSNPQRQLISNNVCYMGALNRYKGFHVLAKAWPIVIENVPDAKLYVLGTGKLYDRTTKLGMYGIAEDSYEKSFMRYLTDKKGELLPSVTFLGNVGSDKIDIISKAAVGVVNPSAITETFCISAIEMGACGVPVCTKGAYGLIDTVIDKQTGLYSNNYKELANNIITLLKNKEMNIRLGKNAIENANRFNPSIIVREWKNLLKNISSSSPNTIDISEFDDKNDLLSKYKKSIYKIRIQKGISFVPSFTRFEYFFKGMYRVFFRDIIYHWTGKGI